MNFSFEMCWCIDPNGKPAVLVREALLESFLTCGTTVLLSRRIVLRTRLHLIGPGLPASAVAR